MTSSNIVQSNILDILFENRNKSYGAYPLRKFYNRRLMIALFCTTAIAAFLVLLVSYGQDEISPTVAGTFPPENAFGSIKEIVLPKPKPPKASPPKPMAPPQRLKTLQFVSNIKIERNEKLVAALSKNLDSFVVGSRTADGITDAPIQIITPNKISFGNAREVINPMTTTVNNEPLTVADIMPQFPGGNKALHQFLQRNLQNPQDIEAGETRTVKVRFVVDLLGQVSLFTVAQDGGTAFNNEVLRVLKKMPPWIPGKSAGRNVAVYFTVPVLFQTAD